MAVVLVVAWFACVDWSWFVEICPDCGYGNDVAQYRVGGFVVYEEAPTPYHTIAEQVARDLGTPCSHPHLGRYHRHRWWGLCFCKCPCIVGTIRIIGDDSWYDATVQARVQSLAAQDPTVRDEFRQRIMIDHDATWW